MELSVIKYGLSIAGLAATAGIIGLSQSFSGVSSALSISSLSQTSGSVNGGNTITIKGEGFLESVIKDDPIVDMERGAGNFAFVVTKSGRVFSWGNNSNGQLATGDRVNRLVPTEVTNNFNLLPSDRVTDITIGYTSAIARTVKNHFYSWDQCSTKALFSPNECQTADTTKPIDVTGKLPSNISKITLGNYSGLLITSDHKVMTWGSAAFLGDSAVTKDTTAPVDITSKISDEVMDGAIIDQGVYVITKSGKIYGWSRWNALITNTNPWDNYEPTDVTNFAIGNNKAIQIMSDSVSNLGILTNSGRVYMTGPNDLGQLGVNNTDNHKPSFMPLVIPNKIKNLIVINQPGSYAVSVDDQVYTWGYDDRGTLGRNMTKEQFDNRQNIVNTPATFDDLAQAYRSSALIKLGLVYDNNKLYSFGSNWYGTLGVGNRIPNGTDYSKYTSDEWFKLTYQPKPIDITANFTDLATTQPTVSDIRFGINKADYTVKDNNTIKVTAPAHAAGKVDITITDNEGNKTVLRNGYEYVDNTPTKEPKLEDKPEPNTRPETKPDEPASPDYITPGNDNISAEANSTITTPTITAPNTGV